MGYVLIMIVLYSAPAVHSHEFRTQEACEQARAAFLATRAWAGTFHAICTPKG